MGKSLKGKELGKGISQRKDGLYQARYTNRFGERKSLYASTYTEIVKKLRQAEYTDDKKLNSYDDSMTVNKWFEVWLDTFKKQKCRDTTLAAYERMFRIWISPAIGEMKLKDLTPVHVQKILNSLSSKSSRCTARTVMANMFKYAVASELMVKNVALNADVKRSQDEDIERTFLTDDNLNIIMKYSEGLLINDIYRLMLQTGMRIGEVIGLTWGNVDYDSNVIHVVQQMVTVKDPETKKWVNEVHKPKSKAGIRDIPMTKETKEIFAKIRKEKSVIKFPSKSDYVFSTKNNTPHFRATISKMSDQVRNRIWEDYPDFPKFSPHSFRHTFASKMIMVGVKPKVLQKILGHNQLQMTMDLYCHVYDDQLQEAMDLFENGVGLAY